MKLTELALISLQTAFMQRDLTTRGMCEAVQGNLSNSIASVYNIMMYQMLNTATDTKFANELIDELAWQFHTDYYDKSADFEVKKALVKQSIKLHQKKGTPQAVIDLIRTAFPTDVYLLEWFNYGGKPYHFKLVTSQLPTVEEEAKIRKALLSVKNARSYLEFIELFKTMISNAKSKIDKSKVIEYKANVGFFKGYGFETDELYAIGLGEKVYCFVDTEVE